MPERRDGRDARGTASGVQGGEDANGQQQTNHRQ